MRPPGTTEAIRPEKEEEGLSELAKIVIGCSVGACGLLLILIIVVIVKKFRPKDRKTEYMMYQEKVSDQILSNLTLFCKYCIGV